MLSALPKLADRSFILGFLCLRCSSDAGTLWLLSHYPDVADLLRQLANRDPGSAAFVLVGMWVLAVFMLTLNHPLYRLLEGYSWPVSKLNGRKQKYQGRLRDGQAELRELFTAGDAEGDAFPDTDLDRYRKLTWNLQTWLPSRQSDVMPTAFGNAIKPLKCIRAMSMVPTDRRFGSAS